MNAPGPSISPFLRGAFEPVTDERDDTGLTVTGEMPADLQGTFLRVGPNPQFAPIGAYHPFDGDGMLHALTIRDGSVSYRNRWVDSKGLQVERQRGRAVWGGLTEMSFPDREAVEAGGLIKNTANTNTVRHAGRTLALLEACLPTQIGDDLETIGELDFGGKLTGAFTAHPKVDPISGEMIFFGYGPFPPYLRYHVVSATGELVHSVDLELPAPVMIHDFVVTEHWTIFFDAPAIFDVRALAAGGPITSWRPENGTRIGVMPRFGDAGSIRWFEVDNQYVVHFFNAWEQGSTVHIAAPRTSVMPGALGSVDVSGAESPLPWRWSIDLETGKVSETQLDDVAGEFPRVNERFATRPTRYLYNSTSDSWDMTFDFKGVIKYDLEKGRSTHHRHADRELAGEHVFAPRPGASSEDDGWLLSLVLDRETRTTDLVVLDARDLESGPVARVHLPRRVPIGFHANWIPAGS